ncbi:MAG: hypothetical protein KJO02_07370 [Erythrobacter sp.]|nr:hypothetical protein [Erythrobacter sp.]NNC52728.1 hypothetical protein [Erythrobacter sp.]
MTTTIEVNVMGWNPDWGSDNKPYFTGDFVFQQISPPGKELMTTDGSLNLEHLEIDGKVEIIFHLKSPFVAYQNFLYPVFFDADAESNFWVLEDKGKKPKKTDGPTGTGQFTVTRPDEHTLKVVDANGDHKSYIYCLAMRLGIDVSGDNLPEWFVADPKITNRGNDRIIRMAQYQSAD